ncbi:hypothetical protein [Massilia oculi]|uniref:hypothetical protein n=1 Tax=Massilia oculi TaxID=945844 RepID=UPI0028ADD3E2|nr:hypothetical protein [Massilia oculi]
MTTIKIIAAVYLLVFGIANQVIDYEHGKRREGKFMMWPGYLGIWLMIATLVTGRYQLATH